MNCRIAYEYSLDSAPEDFVARVPSQIVDGVPDKYSSRAAA
jgi:hypothetical protein